MIFRNRTRRHNSNKSIRSSNGRKYGADAFRPRLTLESLEDRRLLTVVAEGLDFWGPVGPRPTINGQVESIPSTGAGANSVVGAVHTLLADSIDADVMYLGATNGGIWRSTDATAASPTWEPLTDEFPSLSTGAMEFDVTDATNQTILVGIGHTSSWSRIGGTLSGLLRTTDGGTTWSQLGQDDLTGRNIVGVAIRGDEIVIATNTFGGGTNGGVYRSDDGGESFTLVPATAGLTAGSAFDLVGDPTDPNRLYVSVQAVGLFRTDDLGISWDSVSLGDVDLTAAFTVGGNNNAEMSVASNGRLYVGVIANGQPNYLGFSDNPAAGAPAWTEMDLPITQESNGDFEGLSPRSKPGGQGAIHFSILADPNTPTTVYVGGDRQDSPFPNAIGSNAFSGRLFRGDTTVAPTNPGSTTNTFSPQWEHLTSVQNMGFAGGGTASNSSPHADSREMVFDANGDLIEGDDGGIYRRTNPGDNTGDWFSLIGSLQNTEFHDIAYDSNSNIIIGGAQDTGTPEQTGTGSFTWDSVTQADGGDVAVDTLIGGGNSLRYSSTQTFTTSFSYTVYDVANTPGATVAPALTVGGGGAAITNQFATPIITNRFAPNRLILGGGNSTYESLNRGENLTEIAPGLVINAPTGGADRDGIPAVYGGRLNGADDPEILYVGSNNQVFLRTTAGGPLNPTSPLPAGATNVQGIAVDPENWMTVYVVDADQVFRSFDGGGAWEEVTGINDFLLRTVDVVNGPNGVDAILVGAASGVHRMLTNNDQIWTEYGAGLPNAPVADMTFDVVGDLLLAGTLGRGAWTIDTPINLFNPSVLTICGDEDHINQDDEIRLVRNADNTTLLDVFLNNVSVVPDFQMPLGLFQQINVFGVGGNDELIVDSTNGLITVPSGIRYDGDGVCPTAQPGFGFNRGFDRLTLVQQGGPTNTSETLIIGQLPGSGISQVTNNALVQNIVFEELEPITTLVPADSFTVTGDPRLASILQDDNQITYTSSNILVGGGRIEVDNFEPIEFSNKTNVVIDSGSGDDTIVLNNPFLPTGLETISVFGGNGNDTITMIGLPDASGSTFVSVAASGGDGDDVIDASLVAVNTPITLYGDGGEDRLIGGRGDDTLNGGNEDDVLIGGDPTRGSLAIGNNTYDGGSGFDTVVVLGTLGNDVITVDQSDALNFGTYLNGLTAIHTASFVEQVSIEPGAGDDVIGINVDDSLVLTPQQSFRFRVLGGSPNASDQLVVRDDGLGDLVILREGTDGRSGSVTVGPLAPVHYEGIESVSITPLDSVTGATGVDAMGRLLVFKPDPFDNNDSRLVATHLGQKPTFIRSLSIDPGPTVLPAPFGSIPGDQDWFEFTPDKIGTFRFEVLFDQIETLANGRAGLPNNGDIDISVFDEDGVLIAGSSSITNNESVDISMAEGNSYFLRVDGFSDGINVYDLNVVEVDRFGPTVEAVNITGIDYNLFDPKPSVDGPTPPITSITIDLKDLPVRAPGDLYPTLDAVVAGNPGHYQLVGDHSGTIPIASVIVNNVAPVVGSTASATIELQFDFPLPDDRFTLTLSEGILDPAGNALDGETNASEPHAGGPIFPAGDGVPGGDFVARFTVDSRPEIATWSQGVVYADINGNFVWDPEGQDNDFTNRDFVFNFGEITDGYFAGNFSQNALPGADGILGTADDIAISPDDATSSGFDKIGAYGAFNGVYQFFLDTNDDGVGDLVPSMAFQVNAIPLAGNFFHSTADQAAVVNGQRPRDEIGAFDGSAWYLDVDGNNQIDADERFPTALRGNPIVGDFNGDGVDDLGVYNNDTGVFTFDLVSSYNAAGPVIVAQDQLTFGFSGFGDVPVVGDVNLDGVDDIVMWVPGREGQLPKDSGEFHFLVSDNVPQNPVATDLPSDVFGPFSPAPLGNDLIAAFGDDFALPLIGNFDPPIETNGGGATLAASLTNQRNPLDTTGDGVVTVRDALVVINALSRNENIQTSNPLRAVASWGGFWLDASQDGVISPLDALHVINGLALQRFEAEATNQAGWAVDADIAITALNDDNDDLLDLLAVDAELQRVKS